ncbi:hypothetical protein UA08_01841 [Talaromyces atroroseus]|uniref:BTB domain-containing protein n=1 Tax=Talaromyces atroroseus TaxID=1441469 RepID=A0A1Q5QBB7_TALAT|nr:hypothetical protein UA08_01841 [Talaromyces atroroseus]OKL63247.1 hypothetical protein UA08_01841 [Talaromyces atroroseus]
MDSPTHVIDPDGEVIIVLQNANSSFAETTEEDVVANGSPHTVTKYDEETSSPTEEPVDAQEDVAADEPDPTEKTSAEEPIEQPDETGPLPKSPDKKCFRIQVSAKHLTLASPVFKKLLTSHFKEGITYLQTGSVEVIAESWDLEALLILLRAIHGQQYQIPQKLSLDVVANIALLVDYYECAEAVYIWTTLWIAALEKELSKAYSRDSISWLFICKVFRLSARFRETTSIVMSCSSSGWISNFGLPIPDQVIAAMNKCREEAIAKLIDKLHQTLTDLLNDSRGCSYECRSIMYGALTKQMQSNDLLSPRPVTPFPGVSYKQLVQKVSGFRSPQWVVGERSRYYHSCLGSSFARLFGELSDSIEGLHLENFVPPIPITLSEGK